MFITTIKNVTEEKKKLKSLIGFLSAKKIENYNRGRNGAGQGDGNLKQST